MMLETNSSRPGMASGLAPKPNAALANHLELWRKAQSTARTRAVLKVKVYFPQESFKSKVRLGSITGPGLGRWLDR
jgi:hypothetical protein